tara:strand:+ start:114 stop:329 length:216 start_codon:yes stop_codon:yes gene_type:complete
MCELMYFIKCLNNNNNNIIDKNNKNNFIHDKNDKNDINDDENIENLPSYNEVILSAMFMDSIYFDKEKKQN